MDYTSTLETLESFWMAFSRCYEHRVGAWTILYPLVEVSSPWNCSCKSTRRLVHSESIIKHSIYMDYTSSCIDALKVYLNA